MQGIILAGGFGTRLRPLTVNVPKPMVPVANVPCMESVVRLLVKHGVTDILSLLHFQPETITGHFGDGSRWGCRMTYCSPPDDLGTAGAVRGAAEHVRDDFIIVSGDVATDFDLGKVMRFHEEKKALATITLTRVDNPLQYGVVIVDEGGRILKFLEKPTWGEVFSDLINTGIYVFRKEILDEIPAGASFDFSKDLYPKLLKSGAPLFGCTAEGYWRDIGTIEQYVAANRDALTGDYKIDLPGRLERRGRGTLWLGEGAEVAKEAKIVGTVVVGAGAKVFPDAVLEDAVVGAQTVVGPAARITKAVIWKSVQIGARVVAQEDVIVSDGADVQDGAVLQAHAIVSDGCVVGPDATIQAGVKIWPKKWVEPGAHVASSLIWGDRWTSNLFGSHGVSGLPNLEVTPEFAARLGAAYGASLGKGAAVFSSRDPHPASRVANRALICGVLSVGVNVLDLREMPIPVVRYNVRSHKAAGGFHVRISPYDARLEDIKFFGADGMDLSASREKSIENLFYREDFARADAAETGNLNFPARALEHYRDAYLTNVDEERIRGGAFKVVLDYSNGSSTVIFPSILAELGAEVISLNAFLDGRRLSRPLEEHHEQLARAAEITKGVGAHLGFVLEPGAERLRLIDGTGHVVDNQILTLFAARLAIDSGILAGRKIAAPVTTTRALLDICEPAGVEVVWTRTSHPALMAAAAAKDVGLLVYPRGGIIFTDFLPAFDAMFAVGKLLELLAKVGRSPDEILAALPRPGVVQEEVMTAWDKKGQVMRRLIEAAKGKRSDLIDGVKVWDGRAWTLALPDPDKPFFHLLSEAGDGAATRKSLKALAEFVREAQK